MIKEVTVEDIKSIIAQNIKEIRLLHNMTQLELAERLNYSDKAISKWERAESTPDISVLVEIAEVFGVSLDRLVREKGAIKTVEPQAPKQTSYNRRIISYISQGGVWIAATLAFIITTLITGSITFQWLYFIYTVPIVLIMRLVFNTLWFNPRYNYVIISALVWSVLASVHMTFLYFGIRAALVYLLGAVAQIVVILWSFIKKTKTK